MDAKKLEILMTAVDLGSFSKASEVVGYTQSGLTHLVNSLEREIGFPLIMRSHNGVSLTEQGKELVPDIRQFLQVNASLENAFRLWQSSRERPYALLPMQVWQCSGCLRFYTVSGGSAPR